MSPARDAPLLIDCHAHLDGFSDAEVPEVLQRSRAAGVGVVISAGTTLDSSLRSIELSRRFPELFSGVGIHPMDVREPLDPRTLERLVEMAASTDKVLVMSEIGLDFMEGAPDRGTQYQAFREQIRVARELNLPLVFHSREAHDEVFRVLREERGYEVGGVMHYFQGDRETAAKAIDLGFHISLARPLLRLPELQQVAAELPLERIVLETDAAPQPFKARRENWTEPRHVRDVAQKVAELQDRSVEEVEAATTANVRGLLGDRWSTVERYVGDEH